MRGLYLHMPFCMSKCPYCSFYSEIGTDIGVITQYIDTCIKEINSLENKNFDTIYFGGGTPSAIPTKILDNLTSEILKTISFSGVEFSIEANPESVTDEFVSFIKSSPVTRVSLGVQSVDDATLKKLGRIHTGAKALSSAEKLFKTGVSLNMDMIFDIPDTKEDTIYKTAESIINAGANHISAYSYTPEDTGYLPDFDKDKTQYELVAEILEEKGYYKYEISNFAKQGAESRHNIIYWTMDEYLGIGASAHSMIYDHEGNRIRYSRKNSVTDYILSYNQYDNYEKLDIDTTIKESIVFGLRMKKGVNINLIEKRFGKIQGYLLNSIEKYVKQGLLKWDLEYLRTTTQGELVLDSLSSCLWAD